MKVAFPIVIALACLAWPLQGWAQRADAQGATTKKLDLTADEVLEKFVEATGGRQAYEKLTSFVAHGTLEIPAQGIRGTIRIYAKAPNKLLVIQTVEGIGQLQQGYDGRVAWSRDPFQGLREMDGVELANFKREATFNAELKWRELYEKVELIGTEKVGDRQAYVIRLTPRLGRPITQYYDKETFLLLRQDSVYEGPQGTIPGQEYFSDYREVSGVKVPFRVIQKSSLGEAVMSLTDIEPNVEIDDARFAKPTVNDERETRRGKEKGTL
ncbi:MAG: hypothetical protein D6723_04985 [Acidobacteria bacterium]|nr:MAG: hypothetical protein D6723_04985 [Acidobacteriota bacterium]